MHIARRGGTGYNTGVAVQTEDQILLLVTCVEDDDYRLIVAARRLRDGETESTLTYRK